jgi:hypothetical protein
MSHISLLLKAEVLQAKEQENAKVKFNSLSIACARNSTILMSDVLCSKQCRCFLYKINHLEEMAKIDVVEEETCLAQQPSRTISRELRQRCNQSNGPIQIIHIDCIHIFQNVWCSVSLQKKSCSDVDSQ